MTRIYPPDDVDFLAPTFPSDALDDADTRKYVVLGLDAVVLVAVGTRPVSPFGTGQMHDELVHDAAERLGREPIVLGGGLLRRYAEGSELERELRRLAHAARRSGESLRYTREAGAGTLVLYGASGRYGAEPADRFDRYAAMLARKYRARELYRV